MSRDPDGKVHVCEKCRTNTELHYNRNHDEYWCDNCLQNEAEADYERYCEDFHDGSSTRFKTLEQQAAEARKLK